MDEIIFRSTQTLETFQVQLNMAAQNGLGLLEHYSSLGRNMIVQVIQSPKSEEIQQACLNMMNSLKYNLIQIRDKTIAIIDPTEFCVQLGVIFQNELARNNTFYLGLGFCAGCAMGTLFGIYLATPAMSPILMNAVVSVAYRGIDGVGINHSVMAPQWSRRNSDVLVRVKAACLQRIDEKIAKGYSRTLRRLMSTSKSDKEFPLILGRCCSGVIESIGDNKRLEVGEEVWVVAPYYSTGLASELTLVPQSRVSRKPRVIGFEGAASLPYSGSIALDALQRAGLDEITARDKRIFVQNGCSPVGCVLCQLLHLWRANLTVSCPPRAAPVARALGADEVIGILNETILIDPSEKVTSQLKKELGVREPFDIIFITTATDDNLSAFLNKQGILLNTLEPRLLSDDFGFILRCIYSVWIRTKSFFGAIIGKEGHDINGLHMCHVSLDRLTSLVDASQLQTVVDKVFNPQDAEMAMAHICSEESIGSTVITFR